MRRDSLGKNAKSNDVKFTLKRNVHYFDYSGSQEPPECAYDEEIEECEEERPLRQLDLFGFEVDCAIANINEIASNNS